jgi:tetratricopeptide (TPR) repeat protein
VAEIERIEKGFPAAVGSIAEKKPATAREITLKFTPKKLLGFGRVALAFVAVGAIFLWILPSKKAAPPPPSSVRPTLAVLPFENRSGDQNMDYWREDLPELLITSFSQSKYIRAISGDEMLTVLRKLRLAEAREYSSEDIGKIVALTRATHILRGSLIKAGESIVITASLQNPSTKESLSTLRLEARNQNEIIPSVDELTRQFKKSLDLTEAQIAGDAQKETGKISTSSPQALRYYVEGRKLHSAMKYEQAAAYMEKAVEIDPEFAMAYRSMGMSYYNLGRRAEARKCMLKAVELSDRLPENERLLVESNVFHSDEDYGKEVNTLERLMKIYPDDLSRRAALALAYMSVGDLDKAIENYEISVRNDKRAINVANLARVYMRRGLYQKAEGICQSYLQEAEDSPSVRTLLCHSFLCRRLFGFALEEAEKVFLRQPNRQALVGDVLFLSDDISGAERVYRQVFEKARVDGSAIFRPALMRGQYREAVSLLKQNLEESLGIGGGLSGIIRPLEKAGLYKGAYDAWGQYMKPRLRIGHRPLGSRLPYLRSQQKSDLLPKEGFKRNETWTRPTEQPPSSERWSKMTQIRML